MRSLSLNTLHALPSDPSNRVADDHRAAEFGHRLFFDTRLSANGAVSCASCHQPQRHFADGNTRGEGLGKSRRNTPSVVASAYSPWLTWDGGKDSLWSQALGPLEDPAEHGSNRVHVLRLVADDPEYRVAYEALFGSLPPLADHQRFPLAASPLHNERWQKAWRKMAASDRVLINQAFANLGKAIAAYQRRLLPTPARFDHYVDAVLSGDRARQSELFTATEIRGLRLFIGKGNCVDCHNGALFTNNEFHNTGVLSSPGELPDRGRAEGARSVIEDPFNCLGLFSDAPADACEELLYMRTGKELLGAVRTPSLRNVAATAPFFHKGQAKSLDDVLEHYNEAPPAIIGHNEAEPLGLRSWQLDSLAAFLRTLSSSASEDAKWLHPPPRPNPGAG